MRLFLLKKSKADYTAPSEKLKKHRGDTPDDKLELFRKLLLDHLDTLDGDDVMSKGGKALPVGTVRDRKGGFKYIKIAPNKWVKKYDGHSRGAKMAIAAIRRKVAAAKDAHEMMQIVLPHRDRFSDKEGHPLPFVMELHNYIMSEQENRGKAAAKEKKGAEGAPQNKPQEVKAVQPTGKDEGGRVNTPERGAEGKTAKEKISPEQQAEVERKDESIDNREFEKMKIGKAEKWLVDNAKEVGFNLDGFEHEITNDFVDHVMKNHGNEKKERARGQVAVTDKDFSKIPEIVKNPDYALIGAKRRKDTMIIYAKEMRDGTTLYFEEILDGKRNRSLRGKTLFKLKGPFDEKKVENIVTSREKTDISKAKKVTGAGGQSSVEASADADPTAATSAQAGQKESSRDADGIASKDDSGSRANRDKSPLSSVSPESGEKSSDFEKIRDKYRSTKAVEGDTDEIQVGTELISGKWKLVEAAAPAASHDDRTFNKTKGFPATEDGGTVNDRDYEHDEDAKHMVVDIAMDYDMRALSFDNPVVVTGDGIVISGNNRTMSSKIAARNGTDTKYIDALKKRAKKFGLSDLDVGKFKHPRVIFEVENKGAYDTGLFAKFNQSTQKTMNPIERAVKVSKMVKSETVEKVAGKISEFETLGELYQDTKAVMNIFNHFQADGIVGKMDIPQYITPDGVTGAGKEFMETVLIGSVVNEGNIRRLNREGCKNIRQKLVRAITPLIENRGMSGYSINKELNEAVDIAIQVAIDKKMKAIADFTEQHHFFEKFDPVSVEIAKKLEGTQKEFAEFMQTMNSGLKYAANGEADIFLGGVESREDILARMLNMRKSIEKSVDSVLRFFAGLRNGRGSFDREKVILNRAGENIEDYRWIAKQPDVQLALEKQAIAPHAELIQDDRGGEKTIAVDFDGVINSYKSGWQGPTETDEPVLSAAEGISGLWNRGYKIIIFSTRASTPEGTDTIREYIRRHTENDLLANSIEITDRKPIADVYIDDRAIPFTGDWEETLRQIEDFKPWTEESIKGFAFGHRGPLAIFTTNSSLSDVIEQVKKVASHYPGEAIYFRFPGGSIQTFETLERAVQWFTENWPALKNFEKSPASGDETTKEKKYVFLKLDEDGLTLKFSDDIHDFEKWNHYGFIPEPEHLKKLEEEGIAGWTGNDTWYYIMQHDTWRYMNLDLRAKIDKTIVEKSLTYSGFPLQGRTKVQGMDISIENKKGSTRSGTDKDGHEWHTKMHYDYGYIRGTVGVDKDHLDAYVGPSPESEIVYIVNQNDPVTGDFDEQKVMLGFNSEAEAKAAYLKQYDRPGFLGDIVKMDIDTFKEEAFDKKNKGKPLKKKSA